MKKIVFAVTLVLGLGSLASAQEAAPEAPACLDEARVQKVVKTFTWSSGRDDDGKTIGFRTLCDATSPFYQAMKAWIMLEDFPLLSMQKDEFNYSVLGKSATGYVRSRVNEFVFDRTDSIGCKREGVAAYVMNNTPTVHLCPHLKNFSTYFLMGVLIHEARHVDGYPHSDCRRGNMKGFAGACDNKYSDGGSYGVGTEFDVRVSRTEGIDPALRAEARANAIESLFNRYNKLPLGLADGVFAQTDKRGLYFVGPDDTTEVIAETPTGILVNRYGAPAWFDADKAQAMGTDLVGNMGPAGGSVAEAFRTTYSPELRKALVDLYYGSAYACQLFETEVKCGANKEDFTYALPSKPIGFVTYDKYVGINFEDGKVYVIPTTIEAYKAKDISKWQVGRPTDRYRYYVSLDTAFGISLEADGRLRTTDGIKQKGVVIPDLEAYRFQKIIGPSIWSSRMKEL